MPFTFKENGVFLVSLEEKEAGEKRALEIYNVIQLSENYPRVIVDFESTKFTDSNIFGMFVKIKEEKKKDIIFSVSEANYPIRSFMHLTQIYKIIPIFTSVEQAEEYFKKDGS